MSNADRESLKVWAEAHAPAGSVQARQVLELLAQLAKWEGDPRYQYAGSQPIHRDAIVCRNETIKQFTDMVWRICDVTGFVSAIGEDGEHLIAHIRALAEGAKK